MPDVAMPRLSDSMEEGTILKWLKSDGDEVSKGEELVEIETDKANMTYEADQDGVLKIVASEGDTLAVGETIASIGEGSGGGSDDSSGDEDEDSADDTDDESSADDERSADAEDEEPEADAEDEDEGDEEPEAGGEDEEEPEAGGEDEEEPEAGGEEESDREEGGEESKPSAAGARAATSRDEEPEAEADEDEDGGAGNGRIKASPVARRMARELGLELAGVEGSGPGGRIVKADIEAAAGKGGEAEEEAPGETAAEEPEKQEEQMAPAPVISGEGDTGKGETEIQELSRLQRTVARRMAESKATAPEFVLTVEVDMEDAVEMRKQLKAAAGDSPAPSFNDFVVKASALALKEFPRANGAYRDGKFELYSRVNVGVAVAGQDALVVPTIFDADGKSLGTLARETRAVAERVRAGKITPPELSSGTFTVSNLGMYGIDDFVAVINPPQAAILAVGAMKPTPVARDGEVVVRAIMRMTLVCDHRILYGADAAQFLARIRERLENPFSLAL